MIFLTTLIACLFLAGCSAGPTEKVIVFKDSLFKDDYVMYTGKHDIVRIFVPLTQFNYDVDPAAAESISSSSSEETEAPLQLFFVEGDYKNDEVMNQGLYFYNRGKVTKLLDDGRDTIQTQNNTIYFGAEDGLYTYDSATNTAKKHGTVTDSISQLAYNNKTDSIYYLTDDNEVYKLNEDATTSVKVPGLTDVQEIAIGYDGWLYYYDSNKVFYVVKFEDGGVPKKVTGLPANMNKMELVPPFRGTEHGVILYADQDVYSVAGENAEKIPLRIEATVTAKSSQSVLFHFYGKDKKIYAFNIRDLVSKGLVGGA